MGRVSMCFQLSAILALLLVAGVTQAAPSAAAGAAAPGLAGYRTVAEAITIDPGKASYQPHGRAAYLGVGVSPDAAPGVAIVAVATDSPAARAGLLPGDALLRVDGRPIAGAEGFALELQGRSPGQTVRLTVDRKGKTVDCQAVLDAVSRFVDMDSESILGLFLGEPLPKGGLPIELAWGPPASQTGLRPGHVLLKADGRPLADREMFRKLVAGKKAGDVVNLEVSPPGRGSPFQLALPVGQGPGDSKRPSGMYKKDRFRLAVVGVEYPDIKHNPKITAADWSETLFGRSSHVKTSGATSPPAAISVSDYFEDQSCGAFHLEGKVFDWLQLNRNRAEWRVGDMPGFQTVVVDAILARDGKTALDGFDGILFLYAGKVPAGISMGDLYWPHAQPGTPYASAVCPETNDGVSVSNPGTLCHEFGHMLGLPDLYAKASAPEFVSVGPWCLMAEHGNSIVSGNLSAWCKEQLGWLRPAVIDPAVPQKLVLSPIDGSTRECFKVPIRPDGSEYLLLENRRKQGSDAGLPGEGLLVWRVLKGHPELEASHGIEGNRGIHILESLVPYPSRMNDSFTPYTTPSSRSQHGGGYPVFLTNIRRLPDGRITFYVGYQYY